MKDLTRDATFEIYQIFEISTLESQIKDEEEELKNRKDREKNEESRSKSTSITPLTTNIQEDQQGGLILTPLNQQPNSSSSSGSSNAPIVGNPVNPSIQPSTTVLRPQQIVQHNSSSQPSTISPAPNTQQTTNAIKEVPVKEIKPAVPEPKPLDAKTVELLKDIDFSYTAMMEHHTQQQSAPKKQQSQAAQLPKWFPKEAIEFDFRSNKIDDEFLFFLFYYQQGTPLQLKAAEMLKQRKWKYHKGYQKWFKEHNDPIYMSDVSENGDYMCFEYESWYNVSKSHFTFFSNFMEH